MRICISIFVVLIFCVSFTKDYPQDKFYEIKEDSDEYDEWVERYNYHTIDEVFKMPEVKSVLVGPEALDSAGAYDFSKLVNLESLNIQLGISPDAADSVKAVYAETVKNEMAKISCFAKCPKLKRIVFVICNQIYLTEKQCKAKVGEKLYGTKYLARMAKMNKAAAWNSFGNVVQEQLPGIKLYAFNVEW